MNEHNSMQEQKDINESDEQKMIAPNQDQKNLALLIWLGSVFLWFLPSLLGYLFKKDDTYVHGHAKEALNWVITVTIFYVVLLMLTVIYIGKLFIPVLFLAYIIFCIVGMVKASNGKDIELPVTLRLIK